MVTVLLLWWPPHDWWLSLGSWCHPPVPPAPAVTGDSCSGNTGLSLVHTGHVTWILVSDWWTMTRWHNYQALIGQHLPLMGFVRSWRVTDDGCSSKTGFWLAYFNYPRPLIGRGWWGNICNIWDSSLQWQKALWGLLSAYTYNPIQWESSLRWRSLI